MIREEKLISLLRFYPTDSDNPLEKFTGSCSLVWESAHVVWVKALSGELSRKNLREFVKFLLDNEVHLVKAIRANEKLPYATKVEGNYCEIDVLQNLEKFKQIARG